MRDNSSIIIILIIYELITERTKFCKNAKNKNNCDKNGN